MTESMEEKLKRLQQRYEAMSPEDKARCNAARDAEDARRRDQDVEDLIRAAKMPARHAGFNLAATSGPWREKFDMLLGRSGKGYLVALLGPRGTGKTQLAVELMRECCRRMNKARYLTATEFFMDVKSTYRPDSRMDEKAVVTLYRSPRLLVIDELGRRAETEWEDRLLFELIDGRYRDLKDTILLSNQTSKAFVDSIGPSLASRVTETGAIVECNWQSFRD